MPTRHEFDELISNCKSEHTYLNGIYGLKFTSKKNGNSIFLPASGFFRDDTLLGIGLHGNYWCSSLDVEYSDGGENLYFESSYIGSAGCYRSEGLSVRPVTK